MNEAKAANVMLQLLQALAYMHEMQICHRDLKPDNIIYDATTQRVKIIDFGFAISCKEKLKLFCGTPSFMAPEIFSKQEYSGQAADIWACGVILYNILTGILPFKRNNDQRVFEKKISLASYQTPLNADGEDLSEEARDLILRMLEPDQTLRIQAIHCL